MMSETKVMEQAVRQYLQGPFSISGNRIRMMLCSDLDSSLHVLLEEPRLTSAEVHGTPND